MGVVSLRVSRHRPSGVTLPHTLFQGNAVLPAVQLRFCCFGWYLETHGTARPNLPFRPTAGVGAKSRREGGGRAQMNRKRPHAEHIGI